MNKLILACVLLVWCPNASAQDRPQWVTCQSYASLANARDRAHLDRIYQPLKKTFIVRAIYAERLYAFHADERDTVLLDNLPTNGQELQNFYQAVDCARGLDKPVTDIAALAASFSAYFIDASRAVVRHPEYMTQFVRMSTQFNSTPADNVDLDEQVCSNIVYVYTHRRDEFLAALPAAKANPKHIPHQYKDCP
jgi:hypothetical protein